MSINTYQKRSNGGKPLVNCNGTPIFTRSVQQRINTVREMLTISMKPDEAKWFNIQSELKFNTL